MVVVIIGTLLVVLPNSTRGLGVLPLVGLGLTPEEREEFNGTEEAGAGNELDLEDPPTMIEYTSVTKLTKLW